MKTDTKDTSTCERSVEVLSNFFRVLDCSLARYLSYARPWARGRYKLLCAILRRMSCEQEQSARTLAELIHDRRGSVHSYAFPMSFTGYNDLSLEFLAPRLLDQQWELVHTAAESAKQIEADTDAYRAVSAIRASLQGQAELLQRFLIPTPMQTPDVSIDRAEASRLPSPDSSELRRMFDPQTAA